MKIKYILDVPRLVRGIPQFRKTLGSRGQAAGRRFRDVFCLFVALSLTGCMAAMVAGATAGIVVYDKRTLTTIKDDAQIFHDVHTKISRDKRFRDSHVFVSSFNNVVLLVGETQAASTRILAEKIAQGTPRVKRVYNEIVLEYPIAFSARTKDAWITSQVRSMMLARKGLSSGSIRVVTENGVVYLMGLVTTRQANSAVDVARQVNGVNKVVKVFQTLG